MPLLSARLRGWPAAKLAARPRTSYATAWLVCWMNDGAALITEHLQLVQSPASSTPAVIIAARRKAAGNALDIQRLRADVLLMRPLNSPEGYPYLLEIIRVFQLAEDFAIEIGFDIESFDTAVAKLQIKGKVGVRAYGDHFIHVSRYKSKTSTR